MPRPPFNRTGQVRQMVIDKGEWGQARGVARVGDLPVVAQARDHLALVGASRAEAVVPGQEGAEGQADLEATGNATAAAIMIVSRSSCLPWYRVARRSRGDS